MRVKNTPKTKKRRKKILSLASGYWGSRSSCFRTANQSVIKASQYSYRDRKNKKREFRSLWILRISSSLLLNNVKYSKFMNILKKENIFINRKMLSEWSIRDKEGFDIFVKNLIKKN